MSEEKDGVTESPRLNQSWGLGWNWNGLELDQGGRKRASEVSEPCAATATADGLAGAGVAVWRCGSVAVLRPYLLILQLIIPF